MPKEKKIVYCVMNLYKLGFMVAGIAFGTRCRFSQRAPEWAEMSYVFEIWFIIPSDGAVDRPWYFFCTHKQSPPSPFLHQKQKTNK